MRVPSRSRLRSGRLVRALLASSACGAVVLWLTTRYVLPRVAVSLTEAQRKSLGEAFASHPYWVLAGVLGIAAVSALPVLLVFRLAYGPFRE